MVQLQKLSYYIVSMKADDKSSVSILLQLIAEPQAF